MLDELRAINNYDVSPSWAVRKVIFSLWLSHPVRQCCHARHHSQISELDTGCPVAVGCMVVCFIGNEAATLCRSITDDSFGVFVIIETWHERSGSTALLRAIPYGYRCINAACPITQNVATDAVNFHNHGSLAFIHRHTVRF